MSTSLENRKSTIPAWFSFHVFMRLILTNIIMQHTSHFKWLHRHPSVAQGPSHCHHGDSRTPLWQTQQSSVKVTLQLHSNFYSVSVMFPEWNCLSGLAPLKPVIVLRPVRGWPAGLTCHSSFLIYFPSNPAQVENSESRFTPGVFWSYVVISDWLLRLVVMTAKHILVAGSGTDKS